MHVSRLQIIQKMPQALACVQNALDELKQFQREQSGSTGEPSRLLLPDLSSAATSERHDSTVVPYNQRLQQLEGDWKLRGLVASQVNTACATPNVAVLGEGGADEDSAIDEQVSLFHWVQALNQSRQLSVAGNSLDAKAHFTLKVLFFMPLSFSWLNLCLAIVAGCCLLHSQTLFFRLCTLHLEGQRCTHIACCCPRVCDSALFGSCR